VAQPQGGFLTLARSYLPVLFLNIMPDLAFCSEQPLDQQQEFCTKDLPNA
jgi:hypothetical protein